MKQFGTKFILGLLLGILVFSCKEEVVKADGYGNFEATTVTVSSESNGKLLRFDVEEGQQLKAGFLVGNTDTVSLQLKIDQIQANKPVINAKAKGVSSQKAVLNAQIRAAETAKARIQNLLSKQLATPSQLDDINGKLDVLHHQIESVKSKSTPFVLEIQNLELQVKQLKEQIKRTKIINPINGTVLVKYAEPSEITGFGKPLYKIADLSMMQLRVYVSERQLSLIKIGQEATIKVDSGDHMRDYTGTITWIASEAEFTPKIIQTKEERVNLVYAVKLNVKNDGSLKIGMPAELWMYNNSSSNETNKVK